MSTAHDPFPSVRHDHRACVDNALHDAETLCAEQGLRLTPIRRRVLELIWQGHRPRGAYEILEQLAADGHRPSPPTVYRALDFLVEHRLVHRVNSRNAFVGCVHPGDPHAAQIFICDRCGVAVEQSDGTLQRRILRNAQGMHFLVREQTVEITGICPRCAEHQHEA